MRKNIYTANKSYTPTFQAIEATSNIEILKHILNESFELYCKMKPKHQYNNKIKNMHWNMSCEKAYPPNNPAPCRIEETMVK